MCSCGKTEDHVLATRQTVEGVKVQLWSDGTITGLTGTYPRGIGKSRTPNLEAGWRVMGNVSLYTWEELPLLIRAERRRR